MQHHSVRLAHNWIFLYIGAILFDVINVVALRRVDGQRVVRASVDVFVELHSRIRNAANQVGHDRLSADAFTLLHANAWVGWMDGWAALVGWMDGLAGWAVDTANVGLHECRAVDTANQMDGLGGLDGWLFT